MKIADVYYREALFNRSRFLILYGGAGSGKSVFAAQKIITRVLSETPHKFLAVRKVAATLRHSVYALFKRLIHDEGLEAMFKFNDSNLEITAFNGNKIICKGLDDPEKIKSIDAITSIWVEEATELNEEDMEQLNLRLRFKTPNYRQIMITFNPVSAHHWIKRRFFDAKKDDVFTLRTTYKDNPFLDEEYKEQLKKLEIENPHYHRIYALGEWGSLEGIVYQEYDEVDAMPDFFEDEYIGLDFGYNHATAMVHVRIDGRELYVDELVYLKESTNRAVIDLVGAKYPFARHVQIFADSARPDLMREWQEAGFMVQPADKSVFDGIMTVKSFHLHVTRRSANVLKELASYAWRRSRDGTWLDEPVKVGDDAMDAMRYALTPYIKSQGKLRGVKLKGF